MRHEIAFYKSSAIAQGANIVRRELGLPATYVPAADPKLQIDVVPGRDVDAHRARSHDPADRAGNFQPALRRSILPTTFNTKAGSRSEQGL
jgi:hypothetical protein